MAKKILSIPFESITLDKEFNARKEYDNAYIESLKTSIMEAGLLQPIGVTSSSTSGKDGNPPEYFVVYGFCRYLAIQLIREELGEDAFSTMQVVSNTGTTEELRERNLKENIDRKSLQPYEIGLAVTRMANAGLDQRAISKRLGRPQSWVSYHYKAETKLGVSAKKAYYSGDITLEQALHISDVPEDSQDAVVASVLGAGTRTEARAAAKKASKEAGTRRTYVNKGRPTAKNLSQYVSDTSYDADSAGTSDDERAFHNGVAAGIRVALGDLEFDKVGASETYTDRDYHSKAAKATTAVVKKKAATKKKKAAKKAKSKANPKTPAKK